MILLIESKTNFLSLEVQFKQVQLKWSCELLKINTWKSYFTFIPSKNYFFPKSTLSLSLSLSLIERWKVDCEYWAKLYDQIIC